MEEDIRIATMNDLNEILNLNQMLFKHEQKSYDKTLNCDWTMSTEGRKFYIDRITENWGCAFVLEFENKIVGYIVGSLSDDEFYRNGVKFAELDDMFILPEYRSGGYGSRLYKCFEDWCKKKKVNKLKVSITAQNEKGINFYGKNGFKSYSLTMERDI